MAEPDIDADLPSLDDVVDNLVLWDTAAKRIAQLVEQARIVIQTRADMEKATDDWIYVTKSDEIRCENEDCSSCNYTCFYSYTRSEEEEEAAEYEQPIQYLCSGCFSEREEIYRRAQMYMMETLKERAKRSKNEEEWRFEQYQGVGEVDRSDIKCLYSEVRRSECHYHEDLRQRYIDEYEGSYTLRGSRKEAYICDKCWEYEKQSDARTVRQYIKKGYRH